ncbi:MAG: hypothetical protein IGS23_18965 [Rivularia sp. T60_A2020_040]|nr:hypothetical protein [Rivularia sp. T60_A2020_040]
MNIEQTFIKRDKVYRITLSLTSGKRLPLSNYYANYWKSEEKIKAEADVVANFLSIPRI